MTDYKWARKQPGLYVDQSTVRNWILTKNRILLIDVRDDDRIGGHPTGSLHVPDATFDASAVLNDIREQGYAVVVLFCMESACRGPRCAQRLLEELQRQREEKEEFEWNLSVHVLEGGADQWIRKHVANEALVEDFDNDYWGWPGDGLGGPAVDDGPGNALYTRPFDQPATPWSGPGKVDR